MTILGNAEKKSETFDHLPVNEDHVFIAGHLQAVIVIIDALFYLHNAVICTML